MKLYNIPFIDNMYLNKYPNEILLNILKYVDKKRDLLNLYGLNQRIDSIIDTFNLLPKSTDTLKQFLNYEHVDIIKNVLSRENAGDMWCIAGDWCAIKNGRYLFNESFIHIFYQRADGPDVSNYCNLQFIGLDLEYTNLSDFIADVLYRFNYTIDSIAYNHETDDFVTVDRPAYWHANYIIGSIEDLEKHVNNEFRQITNKGPYGYIPSCRTIQSEWILFSITPILYCQEHIMDRCNIKKILAIEYEPVYYLLNKFFCLFREHYFLCTLLY